MGMKIILCILLLIDCYFTENITSQNEVNELIDTEGAAVNLSNTTYDGGGSSLHEEEEKEDDLITNYSETAFLPRSCPVISYTDILQDITGDGFNNRKLMSYIHGSHNLSIDTNSDKYSKRIQCIPRNTTENETLYATVQLINSTFLLNKLNSLKNETANTNFCAVVMFYAPWCEFCAKAAPPYNALARVFPGTDVYAMDAIAYNNLNFRFGTVAVPNILIFHNSKPVARYNSTERTLEKLTSFVANVTGLTPKTTEILAIDYEGPLLSTVSEERDLLLWISWTIIIVVCFVYFSKSSMAHNLWNVIGNHLGHTEHAHID